MRVSTRLAGWVVAASVVLAAAACEAVATAPSEPAAGRPAGVSEGLRAAVVVAVVGAATVQPSTGAAYPAGPDQELLADDTIITAADGFVMLELHNGHVVRVRSDEGLRVDKTAAFGEPAAAGALADRLAAALSSGEARDPRLQVAARVAGWNMRMTSARTFGVQQEPPRAEEKARDDAPEAGELGSAERAAPVSSAPSPGGAAAPAPPLDPDVATPGADPVVDSKVAPMKNSRPGDKDASTTRPRPEPSKRAEPSSPPTPKPAPAEPESSTDSSSKQSKAPEPGVSLDLPESVDFTPDGGVKGNVGLPGPLRARRLELALCAGKGVRIRGRVQGGKLVKLEFPGAEKCGAGIIGGTVALKDGWLELRVKP